MSRAKLKAIPNHAPDLVEELHEHCNRFDEIDTLADMAIDCTTGDLRAQTVMHIILRIARAANHSLSALAERVSDKGVES